MKKIEIIKKYEDKNHNNGKIENINGVRTYYVEVGEGNPILIIHGFMASSIEYTEIIEKLSKEFKVIAVDLIGFGRSDKSLNLDYSKKNMADVVASLLITKGYKEVNVFAHSMGGEVGLIMAYYYRNMVKSLILVDSVGCIDIKWPTVPVVFFRHIFKMYYLQKRFYRHCLYNKRFYDVEKFERVFYFNTLISAETIHAFACENDKYGIGKLIEEISCPTLIIWGRYDRIVPIRNAYKFNSLIKGSKLLIFENSGHLPYTEEEYKFIEAVKKFIYNQCT